MGTPKLNKDDLEQIRLYKTIFSAPEIIND